MADRGATGLTRIADPWQVSVPITDVSAGLVERIEHQGNTEQFRLAIDGTLFANDDNTRAPASEHEAS